MSQVTIAGKKYGIRKVVFWGCIAVWFGFLVTQTGANAFIALIDMAVAGGLLLGITLSTRTVALRILFLMVLWGGCSMGLVTIIVHTVLPAREVYVPPLENFAWLAPAAVLLWKWRRNTIYSIGASDVMLLFAASALGFELYENAFMRLHGDWFAPVTPLTPMTSEIGARFTAFLRNSHSTWASLAGGLGGLALLLRHRKEFAVPLILAGVAIGLLDHLALNTRGDFLRALSCGGWLAFVSSLIAIVGAVVADMIVFLKSKKIDGLKATFGHNIFWRSFAFASWYAKRLSGMQRNEALVCEDVALFYVFLDKTGSRTRVQSTSTNSAPKQSS